jgi:hypothetical protein
MQRAAGRLMNVLQGTFTGFVLHLMPVAAAVLSAVVGASPRKDPGVIAFIAVLLLVERALTHLRRGSAVGGVKAQIGAVNASFAGNLDEVLREVLASRRSRLDERSSHTLCVGLLHRARHYSEAALGSQRLRATLAVPATDPQDGGVEGVRVWCYDEPYAERRRTFLPFGLEGAPAAFLSRSVRIISDIRAVRGVEAREQRPYRSIVCIPILVGGPSGRALAVLNLDAKQPDAFREQDVVEKVIPLIQPTMSAIGMVLALRDERLRYEFSR